MNHSLWYPFFTICGILAFAFGVWCYFLITERKHRGEMEVLRQRADIGYQRHLQLASEAMNATLDEVIADDAEPARELPGQPSYGTLYRHHGHIHAKREPNRADKRVGIPMDRRVIRSADDAN